MVHKLVRELDGGLLERGCMGDEVEEMELKMGIGWGLEGKT